MQEIDYTWTLVYPEGHKLFRWEARPSGRPWETLLLYRWTPDKAGGHSVEHREARHSGRPCIRMYMYIYLGSQSRLEAPVVHMREAHLSGRPCVNYSVIQKEARLHGRPYSLEGGSPTSREAHHPGLRMHGDQSTLEAVV